MITNSLANQNIIPLTLSFNPTDPDEYRDRQARQLLSFCQKWRSIEHAQLASNPVSEHNSAMELSLVGQVHLYVMPSLIHDFTQRCLTWLQMANAKPVKIKLGEREAEFFAYTDKKQLERWILTLQEKYLSNTAA